MIEIKYDDAISAMKAAMAEVPEGAEYVYTPFEGDTCAYIHHKGIELADGQVLSEDEWMEEEEGGEAAFCRYINPVPGCLVGRALIHLGVKPEDFGKTWSNTMHAASSAIGRLSEEIDIKVTPKALRAFTTAQCKQDDQHSWGSSIEHAESYDYTNWQGEEISDEFEG